MWTELKKAPNLMVAELWKELFDVEGVIAMIVPDVPDWVGVTEDTPRRIMVPMSKKHVAEEVLRKL
ncbi:MAG: hypothetical protein HW403_965 [Dehalococcoidia bacterium]|nr:hypothetical protein [Dehalococcoidia bacterium]